MEKQIVEEIVKNIKTIETTKNVDILFFAGPMYRPADDDFIKDCVSRKKPNVLLLLTTLGGDADAAYRIIRHLHRTYDKTFVFVNTLCKSAGTLMALGADTIIMSKNAELGPLDVQLQKDDELGERSSGMTIIESLDVLKVKAFNMFEDYMLDIRGRSGQQITTKSASDIAASITSGLFSKIYSQIDPARLGEHSRASRIALEYGERIATANIKEMTVNKLIVGYPSHGFVIDIDEAKDLFYDVIEPVAEEFALAMLLEKHARESLVANKSVTVNLSKVFPSMLKDIIDKESANQLDTNEKSTNGDQTNVTANDTVSNLSKNQKSPKNGTDGKQKDSGSDKKSNRIQKKSSSTKKKTA